MRPLDTNNNPVYLVIGASEPDGRGGYVERIHKVFACDLSEADALYRDTCEALSRIAGVWNVNPHIYRREPPNPFRELALTPVDIEAIMKKQEEKTRGRPLDATDAKHTP